MYVKGQQLFNQRTRRTRAQEGKDESSELQGTCSKDIAHFDSIFLKPSVLYNLT